MQNNSGWGCGLFLVIGVLFAGFALWGFVTQEAQEAQTAQTQAENIGLLAEDIGKSLDVIDHSLDTIDDLSGEVMAQSKAERAQNNLLIIGVVVLGIVILVLVTRKPAAPRREHEWRGE